MNATTKKRNNGSTIFNILAAGGKGRSQMKTLFLAAIVATFVAFSTGAIAQGENFEDNFELSDDDSAEIESVDVDTDMESDIEADAEADADLGDLLGDEEASDTGGSKNPDLFEVKDWVTLVKLVHFVDRYWYTVINANYVSRAKANAETQLGDSFAKVQLLFSAYGIQVPFTGPGDEIDTEMEAAIVSYAKGHGCEGNEQSDACDKLFGKLESAHSEAVSGADNSYTKNSAKLMETAAKYDGIKKIVLGLGGVAVATPGVPEESRPWDLSDSDFNGVPIEFDDIEKDNKIVTSGNDGLTGGTVTEKTDDSLTFVDENGDEHTASKDADFWTLGEGKDNSGVANLPGSAISIIVGASGIFFIDKNTKDAWMLTVDFDLMLRINTHVGVFVGASMVTHAWGTSTSGLEDTLTSGADRMYGYGRAGVMAGVNISKVWRFEGTAALLFNDSVGAEATVGFTVTPHPVISIGLGCRAGFYPGNVRTGTRDYDVGGTESGPNLLNNFGIGPTIGIGINLPIGDE